MSAEPEGWRRGGEWHKECHIRATPCFAGFEAFFRAEQGRAAIVADQRRIDGKAANTCEQPYLPALTGIGGRRGGGTRHAAAPPIDIIRDLQIRAADPAKMPAIHRDFGDQAEIGLGHRTPSNARLGTESRAKQGVAR
ncbi:hypothetical protein [Paracoccus sp. (in: a-proteobacteria)]|uniref:hypothetical protein n=1 Tax=Paracoccus sp. TaxID=267 RepID=UPI00405805AA